MKKLRNVLLISLIFLMLTTPFVYAQTFNPNSYDPGNNSADIGTVKTVVGSVLGYLKLIGFIITVVMLSIIGLKYIFSSAEEKAEFKETMLPLIVGCFLLCSATAIPSMVYDAIH